MANIYICIVVRLIDNLFLHLAFLSSVMGIYKRKQQSMKTRKHAFDQESDQEKKKENKLSAKKATKKN